MPAEVSAAARQPCPGCSAEAHWSPAKQALVCPYCGTESPLTAGPDGDLLEAHDAALLLRAIPDEARGWAADRTPVRCTTCGAISLFEPERAGDRCQFCRSSALLPVEAASRPIRPQAVLPFAIAEPDMRERIMALAGRRASVLSATGLYVPYWRLTVDVFVHWTALVDEGTKEHPHYQPADGTFSDIQDDWLVPGTRGLPEGLLQGLGTFPLDRLRPYVPEFVRGWIVEQYQLDLVAASDSVCARCVSNASSKYRRRSHMEVPARRYSSLAIGATASVQSFSHLLLPVWVVQVAGHEGAITALVNGSTGTVAGLAPPSRPWPVLVRALLLLAVAGLMWWLLRGGT